MNQEQVMNLAKKAGIARWHINLERHVVDFGIEKFASLVEQATLERAAKVCDEVGKPDPGEPNSSLGEFYIEDVCAECADAIRALKDSHD